MLCGGAPGMIGERSALSRPPSGSSAHSALSSIALAQSQSIRWWDNENVAAELESSEHSSSHILNPQQRRRQEEHVLRILAENEMLRSTVSAYSTMETKDTRLTAALETTKQLLLRAEQREERIVQIYDKMLDKVGRAWAKRQRARFLAQWAWSAIIKGSALGWVKFHSHACKAFLNYTFHLWRDLHRKNIRKGGRILLAFWRCDLQCLARTIRYWKSKSQQRQRRLRFYYGRCYRRAWDTFVDSLVYSRCTRRAADKISQKAATNCLRTVLREWSQTCWRERAVFWRRHCR